MSRFKHTLLLNIVKSLNIILITVPFCLCWHYFYGLHITNPFGFRGNTVIIILFAFLYFVMARIYDGLKVSLYRISEMIYSQVLGVLISDGIIYCIICLLSERLMNILPGLLCIIGQSVMIVIWSVFAHKWYFRQFNAQKSAIVYELRKGMEILIDEYGLSKKFEVQATYQVKDCINNLPLLDEYQTVFLSGINSHERNIILKYCVEKDVNIYIIPRIGDVIMSGAERLHIFHLPMLKVSRYNPSVFYLFAKRLFDISFSLLFLVIMSPLLFVVSVMIKSDGGTILYRQERLTKDGEPFYLLKFRSMCMDAEKDGVARLSTGEDDDRITKIGRFIRKLRIDELPQMINILKGDMSFVGPRPERPQIAKEYEKQLPEFRLRLQAKAGLTGYAQVYGKYNTTPYDKLIMDLMYISNPRITEDFKIIMATIKILFTSESTEGIASGQVTAMDYNEKFRTNSRSE